jgi:two-component system response regulator QseB
LRVLLVEDDDLLGSAVRTGLEQAGYTVDWLRDGRLAANALHDEEPDLLVLDLGLPGSSGLDVLHNLRRRGSDLPVLILTARDTVEDRIVGLDAGADDYLVKPFAYPELSARLRALSRRGDAGRHKPLLQLGAIVLDEAARQVRVADEPVDLSQREFALLECLMRHPDQVLTRDQLLDNAWPMAVAVMPNTVDQYVSFVRRKLGPESERIETVRGVGYRLAST